MMGELSNHSAILLKIEQPNKSTGKSITNGGGKSLQAPLGVRYPDDSVKNTV
jgi:hypothetical protein